MGPASGCSPLTGAVVGGGDNERAVCKVDGNQHDEMYLLLLLLVVVAVASNDKVPGLMMIIIMIMVFVCPRLANFGSHWGP